MMNSRLRSFASILLARMGAIGSHFSRIEPPMLSAPVARPVTPRKIKPAKRKGYRTTKAEGVYGANLRAHFDKKSLTRSGRNKFYAGNAI